MREIFKAWLDEFYPDAYMVLYCMGEDGDAPSPMRGDRFFLLEKSQGDFEDKIVMWSARMEEFYYWNGNGSWLEISNNDVPNSILDLLPKV